MYRKMMKEATTNIRKLTLEEQQKLIKTYERAIESLATEITKPGSLRERAIYDRIKELDKALRREVKGVVVNGVKKASRIGVGTTLDILRIDTFPSMFSEVFDDVVKSIIKGDLYKDSRSLSGRIWNFDTGDDLQSMLSQGILEKKSAINLAKDLEIYVNPPARRPSDWGKSYPSLKYKKVDYNAMRLARTSINHSYQRSTIEASRLNPYVTGIKWQSALIHGRTCDLCRSRHGKIYTAEYVPLDHPNGLCTMIPWVDKSLSDIADELTRWQNGESIPYLDALLD